MTHIKLAKFITDYEYLHQQTPTLKKIDSIDFYKFILASIFLFPFINIFILYSLILFFLKSITGHT